MNILMIVREDKNNNSNDCFKQLYKTDFGDYLAISKGIMDLGFNCFITDWEYWNGSGFTKIFLCNNQQFVSLTLDEIDLIHAHRLGDQGCYLDNFLEMAQFVKSLHKPPLVINDPHTVKYGEHKEYLFNLQSQGIRVVPSYRVNDEKLLPFLEQGKKLVIKPYKGECGYNVKLISTIDELNKYKELNHEFFIQEFFPTIYEKGERELFYLGTQHFFSALKKPQVHEFRSNGSLGGHVSSYTATEEELKLSQAAINTLGVMGYPTNCSRIDILLSEQEVPYIIETSISDPTMRLDMSNVGALLGKQVAEYFYNLLEKR